MTVSCRAHSVRSQQGSALIFSMMTLFVMMTIGAALVSISSIETQIAANFDRGTQVFYAADAALERALVDLSALADWDQALDGTTVSTFTEGPSTGMHRVGGAMVDLNAAASLLLCGRIAPCGDADVTAVTASRPWGRNNPRWRPYAWGPVGSREIYAMVWVADDPGETDGDPFHDGTGTDNPGRGLIALTAQAYGPRGERRTIEVTAARPITPEGAAGEGPMRIVSWREVR